MTPFTDEDLRRLKDYAEWTDSDDPTAHRMTIEDKDICALLARLEAAEAVIAEADDHGFSDKAVELETVWRKAASK